jgi:hypothetical protein
MSQEAAAAAGNMRVLTAETEGRETEAVAQLTSSAGPFGSFAAFPTADQAAGAVLAGGLLPDVSAAFFGATAEQCDQQQLQQQMLMLPIQQQQSTVCALLAA